MRPWYEDRRIAPSIRACWSTIPARPRVAAAPTRASALAQAASPAFRAANEMANALFGSDAWFGGEALAACAGLDVSEDRFTPSPDGNEVSVCVMRPSNVAARLPVVVYFHGGGMAKASCFHGNFQAFGRLLSHQGLIVVLADFRNSLYPARPGDEVAAFPAGLNDCVSAVRWVDRSRALLGAVDVGGITVAGESGGANLAIATALKLKQRANDLWSIRHVPIHLWQYPNDSFLGRKNLKGMFSQMRLWRRWPLDMATVLEGIP